MDMIKTFLKEIDQEAQTTRKMLALVPTEKFDWQPHPKSMKLKVLATHLAELPTWFTMAVTTDELDFAAAPYAPKEINTTETLLEFFEKSLEEGRSHLLKADEALLSGNWKLRKGDEIYVDITKAELVRHALSQTIHHRAQLGVFLRLLDIPIPGSYGPSADYPEF